MTIAMYCLIQFYIQLKDDLTEHKPLLKVVAIKLVIFLSFWQTLLISFLTSSGAIKASKTIATPDIKIGIPSMLLCIEMAMFSVLHLWAFPWTAYDIKRSSIVAAESAPGFLPDPKTAYQGGFFGVKALADAFNPWDFVKASGRAFRWVTVGRRHRMEDRSYKTSHAGDGLEPTRNQFTAFNDFGGRNPYDEGGGGGFSFEESNTSYTGAKTSSRYQSLTHRGSQDDDDNTLLSNSQSNPVSYPHPMERLPNPPHSRPQSPSKASSPSAQHQRGNSRPKISSPLQVPAIQEPSSTTSPNLKPTQPPASGPPPYPISPTSATPLSTVASTSSPGPNQRPRHISQESHISTSGLTPDVHPLGPAGGRNSSEQKEWEQHDGYARGESEIGLGGGHGVRDNRF